MNAGSFSWVMIDEGGFRHTWCCHPWEVVPGLYKQACWTTMGCRPINRVLYGFLFSIHLQVTALNSCTNISIWCALRFGSCLYLPELCLMVEPMNAQPSLCYFSRTHRIWICYSHGYSIITGNKSPQFSEKSRSFLRWHHALIEETKSIGFQCPPTLLKWNFILCPPNPL